MKTGKVEYLGMSMRFSTFFFLFFVNISYANKSTSFTFIVRFSTHLKELHHQISKILVEYFRHDNNRIYSKQNIYSFIMRGRKTRNIH